MAQAEGHGLRGHDLAGLSRQALRLAALPTSRTARYITRSSFTALTYGDPPGWKETIRYQAEGFARESDAKAWVAEARRLHDEVMVRMRLNGDLA